MLKSNTKLIDQLIYLGLFFIAITFPLPFKISNIGLGVLVVGWILKHSYQRQLPQFTTRNRTDFLILIACVGFFSWNIVALLYTDNLTSGWKNIEGKLTLLILPVIFYTIHLPIKKTLLLCKAFVFSIAICTVLLLGQSVFHYFTHGTLLTYHSFTRSLDFHAVFYSYDLFLAIIISFYLLFKARLSHKENKLIYLSLALFFVGLVISASKNVMVVTLLFLMIGIIVKSIKTKITMKEVVIFLSVFVLTSAAVLMIPSIKNRIIQLTQLNGMENYHKIKRGEPLTYDDILDFNGTSMRLTFWDVAINKQISDSRLLLGYSPGDRRAVINQEFFRLTLNPWYENYNLHNQFVQVLVELGLIGLVLYLLIYLGFLKIAFQQRNYLLLAFVLGLLFFQLTESVIERNKGIVYVFFFLFLIAKLTATRHENRNLRN